MTSALLQALMLLLAGQILLGGAGFAANAAGLPWLGLPLLAVWLWLILRTSSVLRGEMEAAERRREPIVPWKLALFTTLLWQLPALVAVAPWSWVPGWVPGVWHGALLPFKQSLELWLPSMATPQSYWLFGGTLAEAAIFAVRTGRPAARPVIPRPAASAAARQVAAGGEWAPARSLKDVRAKKSGPSKRVK